MYLGKIDSVEKKALFVGCSYTYGSELQNPFEEAYPYVWGKINNFQVVNKAQPGGSNDRSVRIVFEELKNNYDIIFVAWTALTRKEWVDLKNNKIVDISVSMDRDIPWSKLFFEHNFCEKYEKIKWLTQVIMLQSFFKQINQNYFFLNTFGSILSKEIFSSDLVKYVDFSKFIGWPNSINSWVKDYNREPEGHPSKEAHVAIANNITEFLLKGK